MIELILVVTMIALLVAIGVPKFADLVVKARESSTKGRLSTLRSAVNIYYSDNEGRYPADDLSCLTANSHYLDDLPFCRVPGRHDATTTVGSFSAEGAGIVSADDGNWKYWDQEGSYYTGHVWIGCTHSDARGVMWSSL